MIAARPQDRDVSCLVAEDARTVHDARLFGTGERNLDHVDAVKRGVRIFLGTEIRATRKLLARAHRARTGPIDINVLRVALGGDERVRVRSATRLHGCDLPRMLDIADVEDAHATEPLGAHRVLIALRAAVDAAARLLDRVEEQVSVHRHVALSARTHDRCEQLGAPRVLDVVGVEAVEIADEQLMSLEREIRVREAERVGDGGVHGRGLGILRRGLSWRRLRCRRRLRRRRPAGGHFRIVETLGPRETRDELHVFCRLTRIAESGLQSDPGVRRVLRDSHEGRSTEHGRTHCTHHY